MPRNPKTPSGKDLLDTKVSELTALIKELSPQAQGRGILRAVRR